MIRICSSGAGLLAAAMFGAVPAAAEARPMIVECGGTTVLGPPSNYSVTETGSVTTERWDFTGVQDFCLADGSMVKADIEGSLTLSTHDDGTGHIVVPHTSTIDGGTLRGIVITRFSPTSFDATVHAFGGTGVLAGVSGHGTTLLTGPGMFVNQTLYRYPRPV